MNTRRFGTAACAGLVIASLGLAITPAMAHIGGAEGATTQSTQTDSAAAEAAMNEIDLAAGTLRGRIVGPSGEVLTAAEYRDLSINTVQAGG